jgi:hypothetical protein
MNSASGQQRGTLAAKGVEVEDLTDLVLVRNARFRRLPSGCFDGETIREDRIRQVASFGLLEVCTVVVAYQGAPNGGRRFQPAVQRDVAAYPLPVAGSGWILQGASRSVDITAANARCLGNDLGGRLGGFDQFSRDCGDLPLAAPSSRLLPLRRISGHIILKSPSESAPWTQRVWPSVASNTTRDNGLPTGLTARCPKTYTDARCGRDPKEVDDTAAER